MPHHPHHPLGQRRDVGRHIDQLFHFLAVGRQTHSSPLAGSDRTATTSAASTSPCTWPVSCAQQALPLLGLVPVFLIQAQQHPFFHVTEPSAELEFRVAKRPVDDQQHQIGILGRVGRDLRMLRAMDLTQPGRVDQQHVIDPRPRNLVSLERRATRASVANTSRPASALSSDDLPLETVPNATISSVCSSRFCSSCRISGEFSAQFGRSRIVRRSATVARFSSISRPFASADNSLVRSRSRRWPWPLMLHRRQLVAACIAAA